MTAKAVPSTLKHVWSNLQSLNAPMAVMGGMALAAWEYVRATRDVDLLIDLGQLKLDVVLQQLAEAQIRPKRQPPVLTLGSLRIVQLLYEPPETFVDLQIDLLLAESPYHRKALTRRVPARLPDLDIEVLVLACEDLILHKLLAGRLIDRADSAALLRGNRESLDLGYLSRWIRNLKLAAEFAEVWQEAFPGELPPVNPGDGGAAAPN